MRKWMVGRTRHRDLTHGRRIAKSRRLGIEFGQGRIRCQRICAAFASLPGTVNQYALGGLNVNLLAGGTSTFDGLCGAAIGVMRPS